MRSHLLCALGIGLVIAAPAYAARSGDAGVRAPRMVRTLHAEFTLPGGPWQQVTGAMEGRPAYGRYVVRPTMPSGFPCRIEIDVDATARREYPRVRRDVVSLRPAWTGHGGDVRFDSHGARGPLRWWVGQRRFFEAAGGAARPMPKKLRTTLRRWLVFQVGVLSSYVPGDEAACRARAKRTGRRAVTSVIRTLRLAPGPPVAEAPFAI